MVRIGLLIPMCSRNENYKSADDIPLFKYFLPSFIKTMSEGYDYKFYIGVDDNDMFYNKHVKTVEERIRKCVGENVSVCLLENCNHKPAHAWNKLLKVAYEDGCDYFFQLGDDIEIVSSEWTTKFIEHLMMWDNIGVVGPCEPINHACRMNSSAKKVVIENIFFHRKHYNIFETLFHPSINNWYCDNWITDVYGSVNRSYMMVDIIIKNFSRDTRYDAERSFSKYEECLKEGIEKIQKAVSFKQV
jgi:hypothetical protein